MEKEFGRLLRFVGRVATAIRLNSPYNGFFDSTNPQHSQDVMWMSDLLHHFEHLGRAFESGQPSEVIFACEILDKSFQTYNKSDTGYRTEPATTFEHQKLFSVEEGREILANIKAKAHQAVSSSKELIGQ